MLSEFIDQVTTNDMNNGIKQCLILKSECIIESTEEYYNPDTVKCPTTSSDTNMFPRSMYCYMVANYHTYKRISYKLC